MMLSKSALLSARVGTATTTRRAPIFGGSAPPITPQADNSAPVYVPPQALPADVAQGVFPDSPDVNLMAPTPYGSGYAQPSAQGAPPVVMQGPSHSKALIYIVLGVAVVYLLMEG